MKLIPLYNKYKSSYFLAFIDLFTHISLLGVSHVILYYLRNSWFSLFIIILIGLLNVKTFIIFHDCGHQSYTPSRILNYVIGIISGVFSLTPLSWSLRHDTHHVTNGNIENKYKWKYNEHIYLTYKQYEKNNFITRLIIRKILNPQYFLIFLPLFNFIILERFSIVKVYTRKIRKISINNYFYIIEQIFNNCMTIAIFYFFYKYNILYHWLISVWISSNIGVILFHCQHTFNPGYIVNNNDWNFNDSGLKGSSYIKIPWFLKYFTGGIEYHHIHHMNSKIPGYNLQKFHEEVKEKSDLFNNVPTLSMMDCYTNLWLTLSDEDEEKYITFEEAENKIRNNKKK